MSESETWALEHARFGTIEAPASATFRCQGLPGFPEARRLLVVEDPRTRDFAWLVCFEIPELALVVTDPARHYPDYVPRPHHSDLRAIEAAEGDEVDVLVVANVTETGATLNLAAPLLINPKSRLLIQAILADGAHPMRAPLSGSSTSGGGAAQIESNPQR